MNTRTVLGVIAVAALVALAGCGGGSNGDSKSIGGATSGGSSPVNVARQAAIVAEQIQRANAAAGGFELRDVTCHPGSGGYACDGSYALGGNAPRQVQIVATVNGSYFQATSPQSQDFSASGTIPTDTAYRGLNLHGLQAWVDGHAAAAGYQASPEPKGCAVDKADRTFSCTVQNDPSHMTSVGIRVAADGRVTIADGPGPQNTPSTPGKELGVLPKESDCTQALVAGCSGGNKKPNTNSPPDGSPVSKAEFESRFVAGLRPAQNIMIPSNPDPDTLEEAGATYQKAHDNIQPIVAPKEIADVHTQIVTALQRLAQDANGAATALRNSDSAAGTAALDDLRAQGETLKTLGKQLTARGY